MISLRLIFLMGIGYLLGAIPFSLIVARFKHVDLRKSGSGNLGATNVYRVLGIWYGVGVFLLDVLKGYLPTYFASYMFEDPTLYIIVGGMAIVGHVYTVFAHFKGGKGAATGVGVLFALSPDVMILLALIAAAIIYFTRYVALATVVCVVLVPILMFLFDYPNTYVLVTAVLASLVIYKHTGNIQRLMQGKENKV